MMKRIINKYRNKYRRCVIFCVLLIGLVIMTACNQGEDDSHVAYGAKINQIESTAGNEVKTQDVSKKIERTIVWLGDSLVQGSLGNPDDNLSNAPYVTLAELSGHNVEGFGFYGYNTHDIFWVYTDETRENQKPDPEKIYVLWVGSNDWASPSGVVTDTTDVINQIDDFIKNKGLKYVLILGTTARKELRTEVSGLKAYETINQSLKEHYGDCYLDVTDVIGEDGYGPDDIHLTQRAYDDVASLVTDKLKKKGFI